MLLIPVAAVPSQSFNVLLGSQNCTLNVYLKDAALFMDVLVNDQSIVYCRPCEDRNLIVRKPYLGFIGDLAFFDTQGYQDPQYTGFDGTAGRWQLAYLEASDLLT